MIDETENRAAVKVLIAEDEMIVAEDLAMTLQDLGYQVAGMASTGEQAIQLAQESKPALVLMDIKLAGDIDGIEASEQIRARFDIPVIFVTAYDEKDVLQRAKQTEPYAYLAKPFSYNILKITVETTLYKHAADKRLRESEEKYRLISESANVGIFTTSLDGAVLQANPAAAKMAGYESVQEFLAIRAEDLYSNLEDRQRFLNVLLEKGSVRDHEILARTKDGTPQWVSLNAVLQKDHVGSPVSILGLVEDITQRKRAEQALRESEEKYRRLHETMMDAFVSVDMTGRIQETNQAYQAMLGYDEEELRKLTYVDLTPEPWHAFESGIVKEQILVKGYSDVYCKEYRKKDGTIFPVELRTCLVRDEAGQPSAMWAIVRDITDRKKAEKALRESEERYRSLFDNMREGFAHCKMLFEEGRPQDFVYLHVNDAFERLTDLKNVTGKKVTQVIPGIGETNPELFEIYGRVASTGTPEKFETYLDSLGIWFYVSVYSTEREHFIAVFENITDRKKAEEALRKSEERYRRLVEMAPDAIVISQDGRIVYVNGAGMQLLDETDPGQVVGTHPIEWVHPDDQALVAQRMRVLLTSETLVPPLAWRLVRRDGTVRDVEAVSSSLRSGESMIIHALLRDITDRKRAEQAMNEQANLLTTLINGLPDIVALQKPDHSIIFYNQAGYDFLGKTPSEVKDSKCFTLIGRDHVCEGCATARALVSRRIERSERYLQETDTWLESRAIPVLDDQGNVSMVAEILRDITDRKQAEEDLRKSEERYRAMFDHMKSGVAVYAAVNDGADFVFEDFNSAAERISLVKKEEVIGRSLLEKFPNMKKTGLFSALQRVYENGAPEHLPDFHYKDANREGWRDNFIYKIPSGNVVAMYDDVTERKRAQEESEKLRNQLAQAQKMEAVGTLAGGIAHDFNNLLQVTLGYSELLLQEKKEDDPQYADLQKILQAARNGAELVKSLLTFSRKVEPKSIPLNLNRQITQVGKLLRRTIPRMIDIKMNLAPDLSEIHADPTQVEQILMNLAVNARDAMPERGRLTIVTKNATLDEKYCKAHVGTNPGEYALLEVSDTGHGMDKPTIERIFEPFYTTKEIGSGTGLGLAMVHGIVSQYGGHIVCRSEVGQGTTFEIYLPAIEAEPEPDTESSGEMPAFGTEAVLLVDDEDLVRELGQRILVRSGYKILTATNGREALEVYEKEKGHIDLVILDLIMPTMGGKDCLNKILEIDPQAKILIASGYSADASIKEYVELGAKGFVAKPFRFKELLRQVRIALDEK